MPQSFSRVILHTTFSTKYRKPILTPDIEQSVKAFMAKVLHNKGSVVYEIECVPDHIHIVHSLPRTISIADLLECLKSKTTKMIHREFHNTHFEFYWQSGYATHSADYRNFERLREYVRNQKAHHGYESFEQEFRKLLDAFELDYDQKYLFPKNPQKTN